MRFRFTFITGISLLYMALGLFIAIRGSDSFLSKRFFFISVGILGWFIGNELIAVKHRIEELEKKSDASKELV